MEYILEMSESGQLTIPESYVHELGLKAGAHFVARLEAGRLVIERLPFSSFEQGKSLQQTIDAQ